MKKFLLFPLIFFYLVSKINAQGPNYTDAEFGSAGDSLYYTSVTVDTSTLDFAQAGTNVTWNFSSLSATTQYYVDFLNPATDGYRGTFLTECVAGGSTLARCNTELNALTNVAFRDEANVTIQGTVFTDVVLEDLKANASLETNIIGFETKIEGVAVPFTSTYSTPDVQLVFPISYGNRDTSLSSYEINLTARGINFIYDEHSKRVNYDDAYGSLTTPYTTYPSTVRHKSYIYHTDTLYYDGQAIPIAPSVSVEYEWFDPSFSDAVFTATGVLAGNTVKFQTVTYLDTVLCLSPTARQDHVPDDVVIDPSVGDAVVNFTNNSPNANNYTWNFGDPTSGTANTSTSVNPTHTYDNAGTYNLDLIACNTACTPVKCDTLDFTIVVRDSGQTRAIFTATPAQPCVGSTVTFHNTSTNATTYLWNFGDQSPTSTLKAPTHVYNTAGTYTVTLIASNGTTGDTVTRTLTVVAQPDAQITANGSISFCNGDSVTLSASGGTVYHWSNGHVGPNVTVLKSGTFIVTATNTCGSSTSTPVMVAVTTPIDTVTYTGDTVFCQGDSLVLHANTGSGLTYQWDRNGEIIVGATLTTYTANTSGHYKVNVFQNGCKGVSNVVHVVVNPLPNASIFTQGSTVICANDSLELQVTPATGNSYQWQLNNSNINGAVSTSYYAMVSGTYNAVVTNSNCSSLSNAITVTTNPVPNPTVVYQGTPTICSGDSFFLSTASGVDYTYQWLKGVASIDGATSQSYYATGTGSYSVSVTSNGCSGTSNRVRVTVNPSPSVNAGTDQTTTACNSTPITIGGNPTASGGTGPNYTYSWTPTSGLNDSVVANPSVSQLGTTTTYQLVVTDENGCTASSSVTIIINGSALSAAIDTSGSTTYCSGANNSVHLTAVLAGGTSPFRYSWNPGTGLSSTTTDTTTANPSTPGVYPYSLLVSDVNGCQSGANITVTVVQQPVAAITALDANVICQGDTTFLAATTGAGYVYQWLSGISPISNATGSSYYTLASGNFSVSVTYSICSALSNSIQVAVNDTPTAFISAGGDLTFCARGRGVILAADSGTGYQYQWYQDGNAINGDTLVYISVTDSGIFNALVSVNGCSRESNSLTTYVNPLPESSITALGPTEFCEGGSVTFQAVTDIGYSYQWLADGTYIPGATDSAYTADSSGEYDVIVTQSGCNATSTALQVVVNQYPPARLTASGNITLCPGDSILLDGPIGATYNYQWFLTANGELDTLNNVTQTISVQDSGSYYVVISNNSCLTTSNSLYVTVLPLPDAMAYFTGTDVCPGDLDTIYAQTGSGYTFQWLNDGSQISSATNASYVATDSGTYQVITTANTCSAISNEVVINYDSCSATVIPVIAGNATISIFPNPAHESIMVSYFSLKEGNVAITLNDMIGNQLGSIYQNKALSGNNYYAILVSELPQGIYLLKFYDGTSTVTRRIVKE